MHVHVLQKYVGQAVHLSYGGRNYCQVTLFLLKSAYLPFRVAVFRQFFNACQTDSFTMPPKEWYLGHDHRLQAFDGVMDPRSILDQCLPQGG